MITLQSVMFCISFKLVQTMIMLRLLHNPWDWQNHFAESLLVHTFAEPWERDGGYQLQTDPISNSTSEPLRIRARTYLWFNFYLCSGTRIGSRGRVIMNAVS